MISRFHRFDVFICRKNRIEQCGAADWKSNAVVTFGFEQRLRYCASKLNERVILEIHFVGALINALKVSERS